MDWQPVFEFLKGLSPWAIYVLAGLGSLVVIGTAVDQLVDDSVDKGFMKKAFAIPVLGPFLQALAKFSPFNIKPPEQK